MLKSSQFRIASIHFSLFTPGLTFQPNRILAEMLSECKNTFNGEIIPLPVPEDAPPDFPRLIMSSEDKKFKLEVSPSRASILRYARPPENEVRVQDLVEVAKNIAEAYLRITKARVGRMAVVIVRYCEEANPGLELARHFCRDQWLERQPLNRPEGFEIHAHKKYDLSKYKVNSWVRCKTGRLSISPDEQKKIILVEQDLNTLVEDMERKEYDIKDIVDFWNTSSKELDSILNLYFPSIRNG
jgi:hypothetical protein